MRTYELMYILDPTLDETATEALVKQVEEFITKQNVTIEKTDRWGRRRLAYRIGRHHDGYYVLSVLKSSPEAVTELERKLRVTDGVLRFITVRMDEDVAKTERQRARKAVRVDARKARRASKPARAAQDAESQFAAQAEAESNPDEPVEEAN